MTQLILLADEFDDLFALFFRAAGPVCRWLLVLLPACSLAGYVATGFTGAILGLLLGVLIALLASNTQTKKVKQDARKIVSVS